MEDIRNENELLEVNEDIYDPEEDCEESKGIFGKIAVGVGVVATGVGTTLIIKNRDKIKMKLEERKIRKLEQKGYVIYRPEEVEEAEELFDETEEK